MNDTRAALVQIMQAVAANDVTGPIDPSGDDSVRRLGLTSVRMLEFMVAVEDNLGVLWGDDTEPADLASFQAMADYLSNRDSAGRHQTASAATATGGEGS